MRTRVWMLLAAVACGCSGAAKETEDPVFFPPPPNPPKLQFLASYSKQVDLAVRSSFSDFVLGKEPEDKEIRKPYGAAYSNGKIYVCDTAQASVIVIDLTTRKMDLLAGDKDAGKLKLPLNIEIGPDGSKYVADGGRMQVVVFGPDDKYVRAYGVEGQWKPTDAVVRGNRLFVSDIKEHEIEILDLATGETVGKLGGLGKDDGKFNFPTNLAVDDEGNLYVTDTGNFRIQKFGPDGAFVRAFGSLGDSFGQFARPKGLAVDPEGRLFVVDTAFENVQIFDKEGKLLLFFGGPGSSRGSLNMPAAISIARTGLEPLAGLAAPSFAIEYVLVVTSQYGNRKISLFAFGHDRGEEKAAASQPH